MRDITDESRASNSRRAERANAMEYSATELAQAAGRAMTVGDYHRAEAGTEHYDTSTDEGCLLLVISSPQNEMLR